MAGKGALYAGMNYSTKVEPVDFGGLALGFAKISEDKRLEAEKKQKEREDFQVQMNTLYGEEIYTAFDNTGIDNLDIIGGKLKDGIVAHSETLNKMFAEGKISRPELAARMNKLKSQSAKYSSFMTQLGDYAQKVTDLGSDASQATRLILERMDELTQNATPVIDADGNISFLSKSGDVITKTPFSQLDKIMDFRKQVDESSIIKDMVSTEGELSKIFEGGAIKSTYLEDGKLKDAHKTLLSKYTNTLDDADLYDIATRAGVNVELDPKDLLKIDNIEEVKKGVNEYLETLALGEYARKESLDYAEYKTLMDKHNFTKAQINKAVKADQKYVKNNLPASAGKRDRDQYVFFKPHSVDEVQGIKNTVLSEIMNIVGPQQQFDLTEANIADYQTDELGKHYATVEYSIAIPPKFTGDKPTYRKEVVEIELKDPDVIGRVRGLGGLNTTQKDISGNKSGKKRNPYQ